MDINLLVSRSAWFVYEVSLDRQATYGSWRLAPPKELA